MTEDLEVETPPEAEQTQEQPAKPAANAEVDGLVRKNQELLKQVKAFQAEKRENLKTEFPFLTDEHLEGSDLKRLESVLRAGSEAFKKPETPDTEEAPSDEALEAAKKFAERPAVGTTGKNKVPFREAQAAYRSGDMSWEELRAKIVAGQVEGVQVPKGVR